MEKFRIIGKILVWTLILSFAGTLLFGFLATLLDLGVALQNGRGDQVPSALLLVTLTGGFLGFMGWLFVRAWRESQIVKDRQAKMPRRDGDMSDVAGIPQRDPWLG